MKHWFLGLLVYLACVAGLMLFGGCTDAAGEAVPAPNTPVVTVSQPVPTKKPVSTPRPVVTQKPMSTPKPAATPRAISNPTPAAWDDDLDAKDYSHPDDFYYDHYDDFFDYEDAEEYWEDHQ